MTMYLKFVCWKERAGIATVQHFYEKIILEKKKKEDIIAIANSFVCNEKGLHTVKIP